MSLPIPATVSLDGEALTAPAVSLWALGSDMGGGWWYNALFLCQVEMSRDVKKKPVALGE